MFRKTIIPILLFGFSLHAGSAEARDIKFELNLDRNTVAIGESAELGLSFHGTQSMPAPDLGNISGLDIKYRGPSTVMTVINGQMSSSITHTYSVMPLRTGKFQIGPFSFNYKSDSYSSNMVFLNVTEERARKEEKIVPAAAEEKLDLGDRIFLKLEASKMAAYVNELIPVTVRLYVYRLNVDNINLPTFGQEGFSKVQFKEPKQYRDQIDGQVYEVLQFNTDIFATKSGDYRLGPAKLKCNVVLKRRGAPSPQSGYFGGGPNDPFFDEFFTSYERHPVELESDSIAIVILPLPTEGKPKNFSGAVGDYQFIYEASPTQSLKVGDPVTLKMSINGTGNFNTVLVPRLDDVKGFRLYEAQAKTRDNSKTFTQVIIPENDKITSIPSASFSFFNPVRKEYKTISQGPINIKVEKARDEQPAQVVSPMPSTPPEREKPVPETLGKDIVFIKETPGTLVPFKTPIYIRKIFIPFIATPLILFTALFFAIARRNRLRSDHAYAGRISSLRIAKRAPKALRKKLNSSEPKIFYENLFTFIQEYFGGRLNIPSAGITYGVVEQALAGKHVDEDILRKIRLLFESCDTTRFGSVLPKAVKMKDDLAEFAEVISYFERRRI